MWQSPQIQTGGPAGIVVVCGRGQPLVEPLGAAAHEGVGAARHLELALGGEHGAAVRGRWALRHGVATSRRGAWSR